MATAPIDQAATPTAPSWLPLLLLLAVPAVAALAAGASHWRRMRRIAWTRAALTLDPKLDPAAGTSSITGLSLAAPRLSIRARLAPAGHG